MHPKIMELEPLLKGQQLYIAGSVVTEETYGKHDAHSDVDIFCPTQQLLVATGQSLIHHGYTLDDRFARVWVRWLKYGMKGWHTNSLRLTSPGGTETNLVYKLADGHPTTSLAQVLESFDFGLLGTGYDMERQLKLDLRPYLFPGYDLDGPLPLMPNKRENWRSGFISQYNGIREAARYVKYHEYGYDMSLVKDDLATGYNAAALYLRDSFDPEKQTLGQIYEAIALKIEDDEIDELKKACALIDYKDALDAIMEALE